MATLHPLGTSIDPGRADENISIPAQHAPRLRSHARQPHLRGHALQVHHGAVRQDAQAERLSRGLQKQAVFADGLGEFDEARAVVADLIAEYKEAEIEAYLDPEKGPGGGGETGPGGLM